MNRRSCECPTYLHEVADVVSPSSRWSTAQRTSVSESRMSPESRSLRSHKSRSRPLLYDATAALSFLSIINDSPPDHLDVPMRLSRLDPPTFRVERGGRAPQGKLYYPVTEGTNGGGQMYALSVRTCAAVKISRGLRKPPPSCKPINE